MERGIAPLYLVAYTVLVRRPGEEATVTDFMYHFILIVLALARAVLRAVLSLICLLGVV